MESVLEIRLTEHDVALMRIAVDIARAGRLDHYSTHSELSEFLDRLQSIVGNPAYMVTQLRFPEGENELGAQS